MAFCVYQRLLYIVAMEKETMKVVGRKGSPKVDLNSARGFLKLVARLHQGNVFVPKGVFRFKSFEEADAWTLKMITRRDRSHERPK